MPYIALNTSLDLTEAQKTAIKTAFGQHITLIQGKEERLLMIDIACNHSMYFAGEQRDLAFVQLKCYGEIDFAYKKLFTEAVFKTLMEETILGVHDIYVNCADEMVWGTRGTLK